MVIIPLIPILILAANQRRTQPKKNKIQKNTISNDIKHDRWSKPNIEHNFSLNPIVKRNLEEQGSFTHWLDEKVKRSVRRFERKRVVNMG